MKTTIEIADGLLKRARRLAETRKTSLREVFEVALRDHLEASRRKVAPVDPVETVVVDGEGLQPHLDWGDWDAIRALAYEGHGG